MTGVKIRLIILFLLLGSLLLVPPVFAQTSDALADQIQERCSLTQNYLKTNQKQRDLRARVDRLQAYRYINSRLDNFVARLERNNQPQASELRRTVTSFNENVEVFKNNYETYDKARDEVVNVKNCRQNTAEFQAKLEEARLKRQEVNAVVITLQNLLSPTAKDQLTVLYEQLLVTSQTGGGSNE